MRFHFAICVVTLNQMENNKKQLLSIATTTTRQWFGFPTKNCCALTWQNGVAVRILRQGYREIQLFGLKILPRCHDNCRWSL